MSDSKDSDPAFGISGSSCAVGGGLFEWVTEGTMFAGDDSIADEDEE
jgi:hypothetical protein